MQRGTRIGLLIMGMGCVAGCRTATRVTEVPRVDLELEGGNRGYLVGAPSEVGDVKATRQMVRSDIEIPSFYKPKRGPAPMSVEQLVPPETEAAGEAVGDTEAAVSGPFDTYVVQKGETLWSIAAKPEIYGKATQWRRIYEANRDLLKSPDRVRVGMKLKIPRGERGEDPKTTYNDEGIVPRK